MDNDNDKEIMNDVEEILCGEKISLSTEETPETRIKTAEISKVPNEVPGENVDVTFSENCFQQHLEMTDQILESKARLEKLVESMNECIQI